MLCFLLWFFPTKIETFVLLKTTKTTGGEKKHNIYLKEKHTHTHAHKAAPGNGKSPKQNNKNKNKKYPKQKCQTKIPQKRKCQKKKTKATEKHRKKKAPPKAKSKKALIRTAERRSPSEAHEVSGPGLRGGVFHAVGGPRSTAAAAAAGDVSVFRGR